MTAPERRHVAHVIFDGACWFLHQQPRDAWTFELDLRPWSERW
jgi:hypothetical protein